MTDYTIILFYKYTPVENPEKLRQWQFDLATRLSLRGRVIVAEEGINATLEGTTENIEKYLAEFLADARFADTHIKKSAGTGSAFPKLKVKMRSEIVTLGLATDYNAIQARGKKLQAEELKSWFQNKKVGQDFHIVDLRNDYEYNVGRFQGSVLPKLQNFRDVPKVISEFEHLKDKPIVTVCTGDVRCEKASAFLAEKGFSDIYHLDGGIVTYMEKFPAQEFQGKLYVFDARITMDFDSTNAELSSKHVVVGTCDKCTAPSERYVNCKNPYCNKHFLCCENCSETTHDAYCGWTCWLKQKVRTFISPKLFYKN